MAIRAENIASESARLERLKSYCVLDTASEQDFDNMTKMAAQLCDTPVALISLIDETRQWFKSRVGLDVSETPREIAFCNEAIKDFSIMEVPDALSDARFQDNPLVTHDPNIRFYAGAPLTTLDGFNVGTLCVIDKKPRKLTEVQKGALQALAHNVVSQFELRRALKESEQARVQLKQEAEQKKALLEQQKRTEQFMHQSLDAIPAHVAIVDADGEIVFVNHAWREFATNNQGAAKGTNFGLGANYLRVCEHSSEQDNDDTFKIGKAIRAALDDPAFAGAELEYPCHSPDEKRWFMASVAKMCVDSQRFAIITHHDITRRKLAELELDELVQTLDARVIARTEELARAYSDLRSSEERHRAMFENSTVGFSIANLQGEFDDVNPAFCAFLGCGRTELIGRKISTVIHAEDLKAIEHQRNEVLSGHSLGFVCDVRMTRPDKSYFWARASVAAIRDSFGRPVQTMTLVQDITKQRIAEQERDEVFARSVDMIAIIKPDGSIVQANPSVSRILGHSTAQLANMNIRQFVKSDDIEKVSKGVTTLLTESDVEELPTMELKMQSSNGQFRDIRWSGATQEKGENLILIGRDVTKSRNAERALHRLAARLQDIREEERTRISREIHDELGQILTAVKIDLDLLHSDIESTGNAPLANNVSAITELLDSTLTSVKRIAQDLRPEILDALGLVPALEWQTKEIYTRAGIQCELECQQVIPPLDHRQTTQVFRITQEALTNVVRHAQASFVRVLLEVSTEGALLVTVQDNGNGFNLAEAESRSLGMLGMHERAANINASLEFDSQLGKGTTVLLTLPVSSITGGSND